MARLRRRRDRRTDALAKDRIVAAAIGMLDAGGESALTFRALAARLATGSGAIHWHVANKDELLADATDDVVGRALAPVEDAGEPGAAIRAVALALFDTIDVHPWVGVQLSRQPWRPAALRLYEAVGGPLGRLGVSEHVQFDAWSSLVSYILGAAGQNAANARLLPTTDRTRHVAAIAERWSRLDPAHYPYLRRLAPLFADHDDRKQFLAGVDLILGGINAAGTASC